MKPIRWLHISDLHFGPERHIAKQMREKMLKHAAQIGAVDHLFITGDLRYGKTERTAYPAETARFIKDLTAALGLSPQSVFLVPGNHDVNRSDGLAGMIRDEKNRYTTSAGEIGQETLDYIRQRRTPFTRLYREVCGRPEPGIHYCVETERLNIIHLNTALLASTDGEDSTLVLGTQLLHRMFADINRKKPGIVLAHHYIDALALDEQRQLELLLKEHGAVLYLCGHKHVAMSYNISTAKQDQDLWAYLCGTNMDQAPDLEETDMDIFVGELDPATLHGHIQAWKWDRKNNAWLSDSSFSFCQNGAEDGKHYFPPQSRPPMPRRNEKRILEAYHNHIRLECGTLELGGLPVDMHIGHNKPPLAELYVPLRFKEFDLFQGGDEEGKEEVDMDEWFLSQLGEEETVLPLDDLFDPTEPFHISLLSNPGGGKTTLLKWIAASCCFPEQYAGDGILRQRGLFPIWIKCRDIDYSARLTIIDIISEVSRRAGQSGGSDTQAGFMSLCHGHIEQGTALLLIDGLDEINNDTHRAQFIDQLIRFLELHPQVNVVVTSRIAGYRAVTANRLYGFSAYEILPLENEDIEKLCGEWHRMVDGDREETWQKSAHLAKTILEDERIRALATNPLMLTTLLLVERTKGKMPQKRVLLYGKAIEVLLDTWNLEGHEEHIDLDEAISQLAWVAWQMVQDRKQTITRGRLIQLLDVARKELPGFVPSADSCSAFLEKVERRSALLVQKGYTSGGGGKTEAVYEFQHLTFQEYLAAWAIVNGCYPGAKSDTRPHEVLEEYLDQAHMEEVVLLTALLLRDAADLVDAIMNRSRMQETTIQRKGHLRRLLLQFIADEAPLTQNNRTRLYDFCFSYGIRYGDVGIIRSILSGKYAEEFLQFMEQKDANPGRRVKIPYYSVLVQYIAGAYGNCYAFYQQNKASPDTETTARAIMVMVSAFWADRERIHAQLDEQQKAALKEELFAFAAHQEPGVQKAALDALRQSELLVNADADRYFERYIHYVNETRNIIFVNGYLTHKLHMPVISARLTQTASTSILSVVKNTTNVIGSKNYNERLTQCILLLLFSDRSWEEVYRHLLACRITVLNALSNHFHLFQMVDRAFIAFAKNHLLQSDTITQQQKELTQSVIAEMQAYWDTREQNRKTILLEDFEDLDPPDPIPSGAGPSGANHDNGATQTGLHTPAYETSEAGAR